MKFKCRSCGVQDIGGVTTVQKSHNLGIYCKDCGKFIKWANKDERTLLSNENNESNLLKEINEKLDRIESMLKSFLGYK